MQLGLNVNTFKRDLITTISKNRVFDDRDTLLRYSRDQSFTPPCMPGCVVIPQTREEVQEVVVLANRHLIPIVPYSSGKNFYGAAVPSRDNGIVLSLEGMKRMIRINTQEWNAIIEAGVTYRELQDELDKVGCCIPSPLLTPPSASVVSTIIQRNHPITATDFNYGNELIFGYEIVLPDGSYFNIGKQAVGGPGRYVGQPTGPGLNFWRFFQGACGTLGVVTSMAVKIMKKPKVLKAHFFGCRDSREAMTVIRATQKKELGLICFALNRFNLAAFVLSNSPEEEENLRAGTYVGIDGAEKWRSDQQKEFQSLQESLPLWTVVIVSAGFDRRAEEKIAYEEEDIQETGITPEETVGEVEGLGEMILKDTLKPQRMQKRFGFKNTIQPLSFYSPNIRVSEFEKIIQDTARESNHPKDEIGGFLLPIERGRAVFCQFDLHCPPEDREQVKKLYRTVSEALIERGAFFDPPYSIWSEMMYSRTGTYTQYLKKVKRELDPQGIMNPGKLCF